MSTKYAYRCILPQRQCIDISQYIQQFMVLHRRAIYGMTKSRLETFTTQPITVEQRQYFHESPRQRRFQLDDASVLEPGKTFYDVLELTQGATQAEIKRKFYEHSKLYHPDRNKDPAAAKQFVAASQAYHVLSNLQDKATYDRALTQAQQSSSSIFNSSSYSPTGARPASGLSRRRTTPQGPPPSYYRNQSFTGGVRDRNTGGRTTSSSSSSQTNADPGVGPGGTMGSNRYNVPHFNWDKKYQQHYDHQQRYRKESWTYVPTGDASDEGGAFWLRAGLVGGTVLLVGALGGLVKGSRDNTVDKSITQMK